MRAHFRDQKRAILLSAGAWLVMVIMLFTLPIAFCGYLRGDWDTNFWYFLSESGGVLRTAKPVLTNGGFSLLIEAGCLHKPICSV